MQRPDDVEALKNAIKNGPATEIMDMVREMDAVVHALGLEDDFEQPSDRIKRLLRADLAG